jgi:hypothetical protein
MRTRCIFAVAAGVFTWASADLARADEPQRIQVTVERQEKSAWRSVNSATVFEPGDHVRFRISANFSGYLYVMNHGTAGTYEVLFPRADTGSDNRIEASKDYVVPATQGSFTVGGPPGHDVLYWLLSPVELARAYKPLSPPPSKSDLPPSFRPRCDDAIFKSRGDCIDSSAGVRAVKPGEVLPDNLKGPASDASRELLFLQEKGGVVLSSKNPLTGPVVYELRLAHR